MARYNNQNSRGFHMMQLTLCKAYSVDFFRYKDSRNADL